MFLRDYFLTKGKYFAFCQNKKPNTLLASGETSRNIIDGITDDRGRRTRLG